MNLEQMSRRCPGAILGDIGYLQDWRYFINGRGYAGIEEYKGGVIWGCLWTLTDPHWLALDQYEGVAGGYYKRKILSIVIEKNKEQRPVKSGNAEDAAFLMKNASSVIIVPGYGMAVAQAQHALREMVDTLKKNDIKVSYAIHPVAGRMPGHMNVLLAEANVSYDVLKDLDEINPEFEDCDVALILGANDVVNPAARHDQSSPIYGMPILNVDKSRTVIINKRSMNPGFAGVQNELFGYDNSIMVFGDAKDMLNDLLKEIKEL